MYRNLGRSQYIVPNGQDAVRGRDYIHYYYSYIFTSFDETNFAIELARRVSMLQDEAVEILTRHPNGELSVIVEIQDAVRMLNVPSIESMFGHRFGVRRSFRDVGEIMQHFISAVSEALENLAQSEREFDLDEIQIIFVVDVPTNPPAYGKIKKYMRNIIHTDHATNGLANYSTEFTSYCGFIAIIMALAKYPHLRQNWTGSLYWFVQHFVSENYTLSLKRSKAKRNLLATELAKLLNVDPELGWNVDTGPRSTAALLVKHQPHFQIVIFCEANRQVLDNKRGLLFDYSDRENALKNTILLSYTQGHLHLISGIFAYLGKSFKAQNIFCPYCLEIKPRRSHLCKHIAQCDKCLVQFSSDQHQADHTRVAQNALLECPACELQFYNETCLSCHSCRGAKNAKCPVCYRVLTENHSCQAYKCVFCDKKVTYPHTCHIENLEKPKPLLPSQAGENYYAFDLETMSIDNKNTQQVNLVCVSRCFSNEEWVFPDLKHFVDWLESLKGNDITFFAHNFKGFDGRIVFDYLLQRNTPPQGLMFRGSKILRMEYGKIVFKDTLLHISASLEQLPKMFGLDESKFKKGFFPHKFNTPQNQDYVGTIPDQHYFAPDMMSAKKKNEFYSWYAQQTGTYDFHKELVEYCKSDTRILARAIETYMRQQMEMRPLNPFSKLTIASYALTMYRTFFMPENMLVRLPKHIDADIRRSMHGGRTDTRCMLKEWTPLQVAAGYYGKYQDVQSLYPTVQFYDPLPIGLPTSKYFNNYNQPTRQQLLSTFGFICCDIKPTKYLHHPVLVEIDPQTNKLVAQLKPLTNVVIPSPELHLALNNGYEVTKVYFWHEFQSSTNLFKDYFREFIKKKLIASGKPAWVKTQKDVQLFKDYHAKELGIDITVDQLNKNPAQKTGAKLLCNSLWGKFGERMGIPKWEIFTVGNHNDRIIEIEKKWIENHVDVTHRRMSQNNKHIVMSYNYTDQNTQFKYQGKHSRNIALASMITAHARCRLWQELNKLGDRVLYHDTDSIIYEHQPNAYNIPEGKFLGEWECETDGVPITSFVSTGPKCYSYITADNDAVTKVKGFSLNSKNAAVINFNTMKKLVLGELDGVIAETLQFAYSMDNGQITVNKIEKFYKNTYEKGFIDKNSWKVYPFGWTSFRHRCPPLQAVDS
jgi:hypothetical protein